MTNVQKAYDAVYRDGKSGASFNMIFPTLGLFTYRYETITPNSGLKGISYFEGRRYQIRNGAQHLLQKAIDRFHLFGSIKQPPQKKFRYYQFTPSAKNAVSEVTWGRWFGTD